MYPKCGRADHLRLNLLLVLMCCLMQVNQHLQVQLRKQLSTQLRQLKDPCFGTLERIKELLPG